jgi:hypothetical protein
MEGHFCSEDEKLIADIIVYYRNQDGRILSPEEAERYAVSLGRYYDCLVKAIREGFPSSLRRKGVSSRLRREETPASPSSLLSLDTPHTQ